MDNIPDKVIMILLDYLNYRTSDEFVFFIDRKHLIEQWTQRNVRMCIGKSITWVVQTKFGWREDTIFGMPKIMIDPDRTITLIYLGPEIIKMVIGNGNYRIFVTRGYVSSMQIFDYSNSKENSGRILALIHDFADIDICTRLPDHHTMLYDNLYYYSHIGILYKILRAISHLRSMFEVDHRTNALLWRYDLHKSMPIIMENTIQYLPLVVEI